MSALLGFTLPEGWLCALCKALHNAHNHPSGNLIPSQADIKLTKDMVAAGKFLHIPVLDHVIMTSEAYYSFADEGLL